MKIAVYPGSFDPIHNGHVDIIERAAHIFDRIVVAVLQNPEKKRCCFSTGERLAMIQEACAGIPTAEVQAFQGLVVDFARKVGATAIVRGLRAVSDFEYEFQMALMNRRLAPELETVFMMPRGMYIYVASRLVKEVASMGGDVTTLVPECALGKLEEKFGPRKG
jgi:pantetheine-phosphate adenylyltransferase